MKPKPGGASDRRQAVERVFFEQGWENLYEIDDWDGEDVNSLRDVLSAEQFQALVDELAEGEEHER